MGFFFKSEATDEKASTLFFMTIMMVLRASPNSPVFDERAILEKFNSLLATSNEKPAAHHLASIRGCCSLLQINSASKEFIDIAKRANTASLSNNVNQFKVEYSKAMDWLDRHGLSLHLPPTMEQILKDLRGE
jgi:hypothetical protein